DSFIWITGCFTRMPTIPAPCYAVTPGLDASLGPIAPRWTVADHPHYCHKGGMSMRTTLTVALRILVFAALAFNVAAADKPATGFVSFSRLYTGPDGVSHWAEEKLQ